MGYCVRYRDHNRVWQWETFDHVEDAWAFRDEKADTPYLRVHTLVYKIGVEAPLRRPPGRPKRQQPEKPQPLPDWL